MEHQFFFNGKINYKWLFSIAMLKCYVGVLEGIYIYIYIYIHYSWFTYQKWCLSMVMLVYQRVSWSILFPCSRRLQVACWSLSCCGDFWNRQVRATRCCWLLAARCCWLLQKRRSRTGKHHGTEGRMGQETVTQNCVTCRLKLLYGQG